ncbi:MAG: hypothetical protein B6U76_06400 [Desulfurococcales archaeon ex4484_217_2]|nr:MAG: hypothetical protein B6U76_06400 [Desulfurococcales archaeon ex4484_217_2]
MRYSVLLTSRMLDFIDKIQGIEGFASLREISRRTGLPHSTVWYFIDKLAKYRIPLTIDIDISKIGLSRHVIVLNKRVELEKVFKPFLGFYAPALSNKTFLLYYIPTKQLNEVLSVIKRKLRETAEIYEEYPICFEYSSKVNFKEYFVKGEVVFKWNCMRTKVMENFKNKLGVSGKICEQHEVQHKFDGVDLLILAFMQMYPFERLKKLVNKINMFLKSHGYSFTLTYSKARYHLHEHIIKRGVIRKFRIMASLLPKEKTYYGVLMLKGDLDKILSVGIVLTEHPSFGRLHVSKAKKTGLIYFAIPVNEASNLASFLSETGLDWDILFLDRFKRKAYTIPSELYSVFTRSWVTRSK